MASRKIDVAADRATYGIFALAAFVGFWIGVSFLFAPHQSAVGLPRRA